MKPFKMNSFIVWLFAIVSGACVANIYYAQPLLDAIARDFSVDPASIGAVVTLTQIGYALGLLFLVPLGDTLNRRILVASQMFISAVALLTVAMTTSALIFFIALMVVGLLAVIVQTLVVFAADLATPTQRGVIVGRVTSGIVLGILGARTIAGFLSDTSGWRTVYFLSSFLLFILSGVYFWIIPAQTPKNSDLSYTQLVRSVFVIYFEEPLLRYRALIAFFSFAAFSTLWTSLVLPLSAPPIEFSHTQIGLFGLAGVIGAVGAGKAGVWADRGKGQWTSGISLALLALSWFFIAFLDRSIGLLILGIVLLDFAVQAVHVTNQTMIFTLRPEVRSRLVASYMIFYSLGSGLGSIASTTIFARFGWLGVCILGAAFSVMGFLIWWWSCSASTKGVMVAQK